MTQVHKVNDVDESFLKTGKKANLQNNLRNINYKMSYEDYTKGKMDNEAVRMQSTQADESPKFRKANSMRDQNSKLALT